MEQRVSSTYGLPGGLPTIGVTDLLPNLNTKVGYYTYKPGTSLALEIAMMRTIAERKPGLRFLEIGSYLGEAIANVADAGAQCVSVSLGDEDMKKLGFGGHIANNRFFIKQHPNIKNIDANSHTYDFSGLGTFDLVFIDGDHTYEGVRNDTEKVFANCIKQDTIVFWHDYADKAGVRWPVLGAIMDGLPEIYRDRIFYIENTLSAIYVPESIVLRPKAKYDALARPTYAFEQTVELLHLP
jgi:hypothetical protein